MRSLLLQAIRAYQVGISPFMLGRCRFEPTCSHYAYEVVERRGALHGAWLALRRLSRCRPGGGRGYDPAP